MYVLIEKSEIGLDRFLHTRVDAKWMLARSNDIMVFLFCSIPNFSRLRVLRDFHGNYFLQMARHPKRKRMKWNMLGEWRRYYIRIFRFIFNNFFTIFGKMMWTFLVP